ncbi:MAG: S49 family peptidase [Phycisphaerales bacterium]
MRALTKTVAVLAAGFLATTALAQSQVGMIELDGSIAARHSVLGLGGVFAQTTLSDILGAIEKARNDAKIKGVVIRLKDVELDTATVEELGAAIDRLRASGKKAHLYAEEYSTPQMVLGSHCDEIILQTGGEVSLPGVYMEEMFLADAFKWVGATPDFVQVGDYKGASEMYANAKPSPQWDQNINALLDGLYGQVRKQIGTGRKLSDKQLDEAMEKAWMADGKTAKAAGLIDVECDLPDLSDHLESVYGKDFEWDDQLLLDPKEAGARR